MTYTPDNWVIIKMSKDDDIFYKVLAGWSGGYLDGDSWRLNSGITKIEEKKDSYLFYGYSGSVYECRKGGYGLRMNNLHVWTKFKAKYGDSVELIDENTNWEKLELNDV